MNMGRKREKTFTKFHNKIVAKEPLKVILKAKISLTFVLKLKVSKAREVTTINNFRQNLTIR